jgi:type I restriction enzyme M protein
VPLRRWLARGRRLECLHRELARGARTVPHTPLPVPLLAVITGELKAKVDRVWDAFWSGGIANPLEVMEQITYLLFIRRLDEMQMTKENRANRLGTSIEDSIFPLGDDDLGRPFADLRWSRFKDRNPAEMFAIVGERVFPFLRELGGEKSTYSHHMRDARFTIPTAALLAKVVDMLDELPMEGRDTKGDIYEYMLSKIATAGQNGQFRTPRHIISLMVAMTAPTPKDEICDPACGTAGFLIAASEYLRRTHPEVEHDREARKHFHNSMFHGFDFDSTMLRIGSMNMLLHGVEAPDIRYRDSLSEGAGEEEGLYSLILANPPFAGSLDYESTAQNLLRVVKTKKTELLFLALFLRLLRPGGRAAVIVPDGVLFGSTKAHKEMRRLLVEEHKLDGIVKLPSGAFRPYAGVSTAILLFTRTDSGGTDYVWFYDVTADGYSLDDKRTALLDDDKLGPEPGVELSDEELEKNNLPDVLLCWAERDGDERERLRTDQSFCVPKADIVASGYDLSVNRYKEIAHEEVKHRPPLEILGELERLENEIHSGLRELKEKVG